MGAQNSTFLGQTGEYGPVVERKLLYRDPVTGARMMKVCTPEGTIKRVECLDDEEEPAEFVNAPLKPETEAMIEDAKREFVDPVVEEFDCDDCKWCFDFRSFESGGGP
jgi:hypothetical protein